VYFGSSTPKRYLKINAASTHFNVLFASDFHLFGPIKFVVGRKRFRADDEVKLFVQRRLDKKPQRGIMKLPE
jgi:hypothetical protein